MNLYVVTVKTPALQANPVLVRSITQIIETDEYLDYSNPEFDYLLARQLGVGTPALNVVPVVIFKLEPGINQYIYTIRYRRNCRDNYLTGCIETELSTREQFEEFITFLRRDFMIHSDANITIEMLQKWE